MPTGVTPAFEAIVGAGLLGIILAAPLFGIYSAQLWSYFNCYPKDKLWMKILVSFLWAVLAAQYATSIHSIYVYLIVDFGEPDKVAVVNPEFTLFIIYDSITALAVQCFFARRLSLIIHKPLLKWICITCIITFSLFAFISGLYLDYRGDLLGVFSKFGTLTWLSAMWLGGNVACDIVITVSMCIALHTSRTGIKRTDRLINKLMVYSIQTGALTSFTEIFCLVTAITTGFHFAHILVIFPLAPMYCNSLLANLNARRPNNSDLSNDHIITVNAHSMSNIARASPRITNLLKGESSFNSMFTDSLPTTTVGGKVTDVKKPRHFR